MVQQLAVAMCRSAKKPSLNEWVDKVDMVFYSARTGGEV